MVKVKVENETKAERFRRIAGNRANRLLYDLKLLGNCSNTSAYEYTDKQASKIFGTIEKELKEIKVLFNRKNKKEIKL